VQPALDRLDRGRRLANARTIRQADLHQHFGAIGSLEELLHESTHADAGQHKGDDHDPAGDEFVPHREGDDLRDDAGDIGGTGVLGV
jgi:hypothetical protein